MRHRHAKKIVMLTAYDALTASVLAESGVDILLVGDSLATVCLGYPSTADVSMGEMVHHAKAVRRGAPKSFVVGDLPLSGIRRGPAQALRSARRFIREGGCDAVKLEWSPKAPAILSELVRHRIRVIGHVGLTPQTASGSDGHRVRGRLAEEALQVFRAARYFERHGAMAVVLECVPWSVARAVTERAGIPTIGIGAGPYCDGQVLVFHDLAGLYKKMDLRFVRRYADADQLLRRAVRRFAADVRAGRFPSLRESFRMDPVERGRFLRQCRRLRPGVPGLP